MFENKFCLTITWDSLIKTFVSFLNEENIIFCCPFFQAVSVTIAVIFQGISCAPQRPE